MAGNKLRFEVFKRDLFKCQYCGRTPPDVVLELDHINPKSKGGKGNIDNYITACFECNRGKRDNLLTDIPNTLAEKIPVLKEKSQQLKEYNKLVKDIEKQEMDSCDIVISYYKETFPNYSPTINFTRNTMKKFLRQLPIEDVIEAMQIACSKCKGTNEYWDSFDTLKYFCGVCWNKIKSNSNAKQGEE
jgi:hypothetical protein